MESVAVSSCVSTTTVPDVRAAEIVAVAAVLFGSHQPGWGVLECGLAFPYCSSLDG